MLIVIVAVAAYALGGGALPTSVAEAVADPLCVLLALAVVAGVASRGRR